MHEQCETRQFPLCGRVRERGIFADGGGFSSCADHRNRNAGTVTTMAPPRFNIRRIARRAAVSSSMCSSTSIATTRSKSVRPRVPLFGSAPCIAVMSRRSDMCSKAKESGSSAVTPANTLERVEIGTRAGADFEDSGAARCPSVDSDPRMQETASTGEPPMRPLDFDHLLVGAGFHWRVTIPPRGADGTDCLVPPRQPEDRAKLNHSRTPRALPHRTHSRCGIRDKESETLPGGGAAVQYRVPVLS